MSITLDSSVTEITFDGTDVTEVIYNTVSVWSSYTYAETPLTYANVPVLQESSTVNSPVVTFSADDYPAGTYEVTLWTKELSGQYGFVQNILQNIFVYDLNLENGVMIGEGTTFESDPDGDDTNVISAYDSVYVAETDPILTFTTASAGFKVVAQHVNQHAGCDANSAIYYKFRET